MVTLEVSNLHWITPAPKDISDICAHGTVRFSVGALTFEELADRNFTVSATALYLLRSLTEPHESATQEHLFPCCGFNLYESADSEDVVIVGCPSGVRVDVFPVPNGFLVSRPAGPSELVPTEVWRAAVHAFADRVADFYRISSPKHANPDDVPGWRCFVREWERRRGVPLVPE